MKAIYDQTNEQGHVDIELFADGELIITTNVLTAKQVRDLYAALTKYYAGEKI